MAGEEALPVIDEDVLVLTAKGKAELCAPGTSLSAAELEVLVLADDRGSVAAVVNSAVRLEAEAAREALRKLLTAGHLESAADRYKISVVDARDFFKGGTGNASRAGNHLALARRAATHKREAGRKVHVLTVASAPEFVKLTNSGALATVRTWTLRPAARLCVAARRRAQGPCPYRRQCAGVRQIAPLVLHAGGFRVARGRQRSGAR